jgi:hypothetical protein
MSLATGNIDGVTLLSADGASKVYLLSCSFPAYTGSGDSATVLALAAAINTHARNGKTAACVAGVVPTRGGPGYDTNGQAVFAGTMTLAGTSSITDVTMNLTDSAQTELTTSTACTGVKIIVYVLEA